MVNLFICCGSIVMKLCTVNGTTWINHIKHQIQTALPLHFLLLMSIKKETHYQRFNQQPAANELILLCLPIGCRGLTHYIQ